MKSVLDMLNKTKISLQQQLALAKNDIVHKEEQYKYAQANIEDLMQRILDVTAAIEKLESPKVDDDSSRKSKKVKR